MSDLSPFRLVEFGEMVEDEGEVYPTEPSLEVLPELYLGEYNLPHPLHASLLARLFTGSSILLPLLVLFSVNFFCPARTAVPDYHFRFFPSVIVVEASTWRRKSGFIFRWSVSIQHDMHHWCGYKHDVRGTNLTLEHGFLELLKEVPTWLVSRLFYTSEGGNASLCSFAHEKYLGKLVVELEKRVDWSYS